MFADWLGHGAVVVDQPLHHLVHLRQAGGETVSWQAVATPNHLIGVSIAVSLTGLGVNRTFLV